MRLGAEKGQNTEKEKEDKKIQKQVGSGRKMRILQGKLMQSEEKTRKSDGRLKGGKKKVCESQVLKFSKV